MAEIPQSVLDDIRRRVDIATLISEHVALKRSGRGFVGLCPFHAEKTPSFHVDPERGMFHCFGCNAGGTAFTFLMRTTGVTFREAVKTLAARAGVVVPETREREGLDRLARANELASELFAVVLQESRLGEPARNYLEGRGISLDTAARFRLGFAPSEAWIPKLVARGVTEADLRAVGLASDSRSGRGVYGLFRDRLIFPIQDLGGRVVAFGGREIRADGRGPKYLNSPESPLYRKGHHLYGMGQAREAVREKGRLLLVEGYLDVIALAQAGIGNAAGVLGTALTVDQLKLARRFSDEVIVCFDGDEAGRRAALRAFPLYVDEVDLWPRAVFLPPGDDPDSLVRREGAAGFEALLDRQVTLLDFWLDDLVADGGADRSVRAAAKLAELLARTRDPLVRDKLVRGAAGRLGLSEQALLDAARRARPAPGRAPLAPGADAGPVPPPSSRPDPRHFSADSELVELLLLDDRLAERVVAEGVLAEIADPETRRLAELVIERRRTSDYFDPSEFLGELPRAMADRVLRRITTAKPEDMHREAEEWFARRAGRRAKAGRRELISRLRQAEQRGDQAAISAALEELRALQGGEPGGEG